MSKRNEEFPFPKREHFGTSLTNKIQ